MNPCFVSLNPICGLVSGYFSLSDCIDIFPQTGNVETVVLLHDKKVDGHIGIDLDTDKLEIPNRGATYDEIKAYVLGKYGFKVSSLYIAQTKKKSGIHERENYHAGFSKGVVPNCPKEKEEAIMDAFRYFNMI